MDAQSFHAQQQALIDLARDSIFLCDGAGRLTYWNSGAEQLFGWSAAEALGQEVHRLLATQFPADAQAVMAYFLRHGYWEGKLVRRRRDGALVSVHSGWTLLRDAEGAPHAILEINNDIRERIRIETELQESEERLRLALDAARDGVWDWHLATDEVHFSEQWLAQLGYIPSDVTSMRDFGRGIIHPEDIARVEAVVAAHLEGRTPMYQCEYRLRSKAGEYRDCLDRGKVIAWDEQGRPLRMVGIVVDISERKALEEEFARFAAIVECSGDAIIGFGLDGTIVSWNPGAQRLYQYTAQEAIGQPVTLVIPPERHGDFTAILAQVQRGEALANFETVRQSKDGMRIDVALTISPVRNAAGKLIGASTIARDISEQKALVAALQANQVALEQARDTAEAANRAKSLFLASMSHEIRTPMNAVTGLTSLLLDSELTPEQRDHVETIRTSADALLTIINDILDFSKIESNSLELEVQPFSLAAMIEDALDLFAVKAAAKGVELAYRIAPGTPDTILSDVTRLRQIVVNLVSNALKFTEEGEIVIQVERPPAHGAVSEEIAAAAMPPAPPGESLLLHFSVRDTGTGIPEERLDRLFRTFSQVDSSIARRFGGTGLGLAISKRLAELMGGTMWVQSAVGHGSTFHFTVRCQPVAAPAQAAEVVDLKGIRVLIVDDNQTNRFILREQTRRWGMEPTSVESGPAALALLAGGATFDLLILDMLMPEMNGLEFYAALRRQIAEQTLPSIMLTSLGETFLREEARALGITAFVAKPVRQSQLHELICNTLRPQSRAQNELRQEAIFDREFAGRHPLRILLAEDNAVNQKVALRILERLGYHADIAANGLEAIDALARQPYDVIFMDLQMPEMDGIEATRQIRREAAPAGQPVIIAMTAAATQADRQACLDAGMDEFVAKPMRVEELVQALERASARLQTS